MSPHVGKRNAKSRKIPRRVERYANRYNCYRGNARVTPKEGLNCIRSRQGLFADLDPSSRPGSPGSPLPLSPSTWYLKLLTYLSSMKRLNQRQPETAEVLERSDDGRIANALGHACSKRAWPSFRNEFGSQWRELGLASRAFGSVTPFQRTSYCPLTSCKTNTAHVLSTRRPWERDHRGAAGRSAHREKYRTLPY